jgi:hypothetical protein
MATTYVALAYQKLDPYLPDLDRWKLPWAVEAGLL